jgi:hypothetical protein
MEVSGTHGTCRAGRMNDRVRTAQQRVELAAGPEILANDGSYVVARGTEGVAGVRADESIRSSHRDDHRLKIQPASTTPAGLPRAGVCSAQLTVHPSTDSSS